MSVRRFVALASGVAAVCVGAFGASSASAATTNFANLTGAEEVPATGDPNGTGSALLNIRLATDEACLAVRFANIAAPTAMHIHKGAAGVPGPIVVDFSFVLPNGGCVSAANSTLRQIRNNPQNFYLNLHTGAFPAGAIRGQLTSSLVGSSTQFTAGPTRKFARMTGLQETGPKDPDAIGSAFIDLKVGPGQVCVDERYANIAVPNLMHIHRGAAGVAGPIVVTLNSALNGGARCVTGIDTELLKEIRDNPAGFYCNIHNGPFPAGAMRGQLESSG